MKESGTFVVSSEGEKSPRINLLECQDEGDYILPSLHRIVSDFLSALLCVVNLQRLALLCEIFFPVVLSSHT